MLLAQIVPEQRLTLQQLAAYDGSDPAKPIMLAIKGTVFDVTKGEGLQTALRDARCSGVACCAVPGSLQVVNQMLQVKLGLP